MAARAQLIAATISQTNYRTFIHGTDGELHYDYHVPSDDEITIRPRRSIDSYTHAPSRIFDRRRPSAASEATVATYVSYPSAQQSGESLLTSTSELSLYGDAASTLHRSFWLRCKQALAKLCCLSGED